MGRWPYASGGSALAGVAWERSNNFAQSRVGAACKISGSRSGTDDCWSVTSVHLALCAHGAGAVVDTVASAAFKALLTSALSGLVLSVQDCALRRNGTARWLSPARWSAMPR